MGLIAARAVLVESMAEGARSHRLDWAGSVTVTGGLVALVYGIVETESHGWTSWQVLGPVALAAVLLAAFVVIETRVAETPLMPFELFRIRSVTGANVVILFLGAAMFSMWYFLSLYMQDVLGYSPLTAGLAFVPQTVVIVIGAQVAARLVPRIGPRPLLVVGGLTSAAGLAWLTLISPFGTYVSDLLFPGLLVTLGLGLSFMPVTMAATTGVEPRNAGLASGLVNTTRQIGGSLGLAVLATLAVDRAVALSAAGEVDRVALTSGFARAFAVGSGICLAAALSAFLIPSDGTRRVRPAEPGPGVAQEELAARET